MVWLLDLFWTDNLWLPGNTTWKDIANDPSKNIVYPECKDLLYQIPTTFVLLVLRYLLQKYYFAPLGRSFGVKGKSNRKLNPTLQSYSKLLELAYRNVPQNKDVKGLAKELDISERQVERWWRYRRSQDKPSALGKFCEHLWKATYLLMSTVCGVYVLSDKDWLWDFDYLSVGYPHQGVTSDIWWYYTVTSSYCWCTLVMYFNDPAALRSDAGALVLHHALELSLITISWIACRHRVLTVLVPLTNSSDMLLEAAKALKKAKIETACAVTFVVASVMWYITRMYIFPVHLLYSLSFRAQLYSPNIPVSGHILLAMLYILLVLQVYWSWLILRILYIFATHDVIHDVRSSSSEESDSSMAFDSDQQHSGLKGEKAVTFKSETSP